MVTIAVILTALIITVAFLFLKVSELTKRCDEYQKHIENIDNDLSSAHNVFIKFMKRIDRNIDELNDLHGSELSKMRRDNE